MVGNGSRAEDAVAVVERFRPDVAIFAVGLPDGDGTEAAREVMGRGICPVVLLTSHTDAAAIGRAVEAGVLAFLAKPLRPEELAPALDLAVSRFREISAVRQENETLKRTLEDPEAGGARQGPPDDTPRLCPSPRRSGASRRRPWTRASQWPRWRRPSCSRRNWVISAWPPAPVVVTHGPGSAGPAPGGCAEAGHAARPRGRVDRVLGSLREARPLSAGRPGRGGVRSALAVAVSATLRPGAGAPPTSKVISLAVAHFSRPADRLGGWSRLPRS